MENQELRRLWSKLFPGEREFLARGSMFFIAPIGDILRGVLFDGSGFDPRAFYVHVFVQPLFVPSTIVVMNLGWRIGGGSHLWNLEDPNLADRLRCSIVSEAFPFLRGVRSPRDVVAAVESLHLKRDPFCVRAIAYALVKVGENDAAIEKLGEVESWFSDNRYQWQKDVADQASKMKALVATDPTNAIRLLESWETETAKRLGVESLR